MNNPLLSIIVPVYNAEKYLIRCVDSILNQTFRDFEIILVDDGSNDKSGEMCDQYSKKYDNIITLHKENGGQSSARNTGLNHASGVLIGFVDSDDYIEPQMFELLVTAVKDNCADIGVCSYNRIFDTQTKYDAKIDNRIKQTVYSNKYLIDNYWDCVHGFFGMAPWNKIYRRELFYDNYFEEGIIYEDHFIIPSLLSRCKKVVYVDAKLYNYFQSPNSTIRSNFSQKRLDAFYVWTKSILPFLYQHGNKENIDIAERCYINEFINMVFTVNYFNMKKTIIIDKGYIQLCRKLIVKQRKFLNIKNGKYNALIYFLFCINPYAAFLLGKKIKGNNVCEFPD